MSPSKLARTTVAGITDPYELQWACRDLLFSRPGITDLARTNKQLQLTYQQSAFSHLDNPVRVAILGDCTTQAIAVAAPIVAASIGIRVNIYEARFDSWRHELLDPLSPLHRFKPEIAIMVLTEQSLGRPPVFAEKAIVDQKHGEVAGVVDLCLTQFASMGCSEVLWHNLAGTTVTSAGRLDRSLEWSSSSFAARVNSELAQRDGCGLRVLDVASLAERVGTRNWTDERLVHISKHPFSPAFIGDYALLLRGTLASVRGRSAKVLVTDLDDTLWSGTVGDVGPEGVEIGYGTPAGEAHLAYAKYLKGIRDSGILLAINSRNDPLVVEQTFKVQKGLPLRLSDFASVHCHWGAKSAHLLAIADELNVAPDALVFVDDDAFQREEVRSGAAAVSVVPLPADPAHFARAVDELFLFDRLALTTEDAGRAQTYRSRPTRVAAGATSLDDYLEQAEMLGTVMRAEPHHLARIEQLFTKTNQFNLTQTRFTKSELERELLRPNAIVIAAELQDRHSQYGVVAAVIGECQEQVLHIRNWVVSCRVFSRGFEEFILNALCGEAVSLGADQVEGDFVASDRNAYAREFLERLDLTRPASVHRQPTWGCSVHRTFQTHVQSTPIGEGGTKHQNTAESGT